MENLYDVIIIGSGPAGLSAAIYAKRAKLSSLTIEANFASGGQVLNTYEVDNYPGLPGISGMDLGSTLRAHAEKMGAEFSRERVKELVLDEEIKIVRTRKNEYHAKTVILATGAEHRALNVPGEKELSGMGVSYCATCDGAFFKDKTVAVIGGGDVAVDIDMMSPAYMLCLEKLVESGKIPEAFVDESAFRVLMMKNQLGLFENPFAGLGKSGKLTLHNREKAYQLAGESCVLLKNDKILPLSMKKKVIWAGPYTTSRELLSRWSIFGEHEAVETIEDVLQKKQIEVECITGCNILSDAECKVWQVEQELSGKPRDEQWLETITHEDTVVCVLGEHESQSGEAASRAFLTLPEEQQVLFEKIAERTSNIVTVVIAGRPLDLRRISEKSKAVIMAWRPGTMGAEAIVDIVYGRINPSGKLSVSIPWCVGQVPISYWDVKTGHILTEDNSENRFTSRYMDIPNTPLYPFGYGLSYTEFDISDVDVQIGQDKKVHVHCNVCNTGNVAGAEVVQCYYETLYASVVRPKKELVRFQKVFLKPGEKKDVDFFIDQEEFSYYGKNMETVSSGMKLRISIGNSSDHLVSENIIQA